jgi:phage tail tape-measure protein
MAELPAFEEFDVEAFTEDLKARATENASATVKYGTGGVLVGAAVLGPVGGVLGASLGSAAGYLLDEGYVGSDDEPEVVEADVER